MEDLWSATPHWMADRDVPECWSNWTSSCGVRAEAAEQRYDDVVENSIKESEISDSPSDLSESPPCCTRGMDLWSTCRNSGSSTTEASPSLEVVPEGKDDRMGTEGSAEKTVKGTEMQAPFWCKPCKWLFRSDRASGLEGKPQCLKCQTVVTVWGRTRRTRSTSERAKKREGLPERKVKRVRGEELPKALGSSLRNPRVCPSPSAWLSWSQTWLRWTCQRGTTRHGGRYVVEERQSKIWMFRSMSPSCQKVIW